MHSGLCERYAQPLGLTPSGLDVLFRTRPRAFWQQPPIYWHIWVASLPWIKIEVKPWDSDWLRGKVRSSWSFEHLNILVVPGGCFKIVHEPLNLRAVIVNSLRPRQNGRHFPDDSFKRIFLNENVRISIKISLKFVPRGPINKIPALV